MFFSAMLWVRERCSANNAGRISPRVLLTVTLGALVLWGVTSAVTAETSDPKGLIATPTTASRLPPSSTTVDLRPSVPGVAVVGSKAPAFYVPNLMPGERVAVASSNTAPTLLNFWASWCIPCREEFPELRSLRKKYSLSELSMVGITFKDNKKDALRFARSERANWQLAFDADSSVAKDYGVRAAPQTFLIDASGVIVRRWYGRPAANELTDGIAALLKAK